MTTIAAALAAVVLASPVVRVGLDRIDGGPGGLSPTTVIDLTGTTPKIVREGAGDTAPFLER